MSLRAQSLKDIFTFTRASTATYFDINGTLTTAAVDEPRIDYDPDTLACRGLLIEEERTNLIVSTESYLTDTVTVTAVPHTLSFYGTGTITLSGASTAGPLVGTGAMTRVSLVFTPTAGTLTLALTGSATMAQLEVGTHATSWIPATSGPLTRAQDVCSTTTLTPWFDEDEGTIYVEYMIPYAHNVADTAFRFMAEAHDGSYFGNVAAYLYGGVRYSGTASSATSPNAQAGFNNGAFTAGVVQKQAYAWAADDIASIASGSTLQTDTSATLPTGLTTFALGRTGSNPNGYIRKVKFYPRRLSNTELAALVA